MVSLLKWVHQDWQRLFGRSGLLQLPQPGLYTYRFHYLGGQRRVHLRIDQDSSCVMFVDVTDVVHLNSTAARMAKWALDGIPHKVAEQLLQVHFGRAHKLQIRQDLQAIYAMVDRFADPGLGCATCAVGSVARQPLFSTAVAAPYKADLAITYKCNNDCPHCYNEADRLELEAMQVDDWKRVIDRLYEVGIPHLIFTGGEATLYRDLPKLIAHADSLGSVCGLNTNGRRFAQLEYARQLAQAGLNHVQITLGSHRSDIHDRMMNAKCFEQTVRGIRNAQAAGLHTITNTTLMKMNASEIVQTIDFIHSLGIRTFAVNGMIYSGGGFDTGQAIREEHMPALLIRIRDRAAELGMKFLWYTPTMYCRLSPVELEIGAKRCNAGEYSLCVEPNADVLPCQSYYSAAGNLLRDPWEKIWHSQLFHSFRDRELDPQRSGLPEMCWKCPDLPLCGGGCRIEREAADGIRSSGGCASGGCKSGGCKSSGCSSGGCDSHSPALSLASGEYAVSPDDNHGANTLPQGFVSIQSLLLPGSVKRRGTGVFAD